MQQNPEDLRLVPKAHDKKLDAVACICHPYIRTEIRGRDRRLLRSPWSMSEAWSVQRCENKRDPASEERKAAAPKWCPMTFTHTGLIHTDIYTVITQLISKLL